MRIRLWRPAVSAPGVVAAEHAVALRHAPARSATDGARLLSATTVLAGALTYVFLVLAARTLGPHAYGRVAVLWGAIFIGAVVLFRPLEQTASRTIADRLARGDEVRSVLRALIVVGAGAVVVTVVAIGAAWGPITKHAFLGDGRLTALLLAGVVAYGISYVVRGLVGGVRWFGGYGLVLTADGVARLVVAAPLLLVASTQLAGGAMVAAGLAGAIVPLAVGRRRIESALTQRTGSEYRIGSAFAFAAPAMAIAAADQLLINGAPLLVILDGGAQATKSAGVVFAATMLVRAPIYVFQGLAASFLPNLTALAAVGDRERFREAVARCCGTLLAIGAVLVAGVALLGTDAMRMLYGSGYSAGRGSLILLGLGAALYLGAGTVSQGLLALDRGRAAAIGWTVGAVAFVGLFLVLPGSELWRASFAFALAMVGSTILLAGALWREARTG
jgi:O-antigen/teichoic acid export membrane protein